METLIYATIFVCFLIINVFMLGDVEKGNKEAEKLVNIYKK